MNTATDIQSDEFRSLIQRIEDKEEALSYSSLREFAISPRHYIRYKMREKKTTDAMIFGSLVDCMLLTPDETKERFAVAPNVDRRTKDGKVKYSAFVKQAGEREVVTSDQYSAAERIKKEVYANSASRFLLNATNTTQLKLEYEWEGWKWRGFVDADADTFTWDLKMVSQFNPDKFLWKVRDMKYHWQAAAYTRNAGRAKDAYILAIDTDSFLPAVFKLSKNLIENAQAEMRDTMEAWRRCVMLNQWNQGYEFWGPERGIFQI